MPPIFLSPLLQQALTASQDNDTADALALLKQARKEEPDSAWACFLLGAQLAQVGRYDEAESEYSNAVQRAPDMLIARYELGTLQFTLGRPMIALATWQPIMSLPHDHYLHHFIHGYTALIENNLPQACVSFEKGIASNAENPPLNGNIQLLLARLREAAPPAPVIESMPEEVASEHFLLSGYGRNLH